jgi:predicted RNase H-like HicB family nuclease
VTKTYVVHCEWDDTGWWVVTVPEVHGAVTQSRRLDHVTRDVAEVLSLLTGERPDEYDLDLEAHLPEAVGVDTEWARALRREAERAAAAAQEATAQAARRLHAATRLTYRDIGALLGISHQRAQQLATAQAPTGPVALAFAETRRGGAGSRGLGEARVRPAVEG